MPFRDADTWSPYPEDQGLAATVPPRSQLTAVLHSVNTTDTPQLTELWVNFVLTPEDEVVQYLHPIVWYGGILMSIPPGTQTILRSPDPSSCPAPRDLRIVDLQGDMHAHGRRITAMTLSGAPETVFEDHDWTTLDGWRFNRAVTNPVPDAATARRGALSGILDVKAGSSFGWECEVVNDSSINLTYSTRVYGGEMCNVAGRYASPSPSDGAWTCAFM
jgi:hypothetical protein